MSTEIDTLVEQYNEAKKKFQDEGKVILKSSFKEFFEANPEIKAIRWTQYSPYFNDGDPCVFHVYDFAFNLTDNFAEEDSDDEDSWEYVYGYQIETQPQLQQNFFKFSNAMDKLPEDIFLSLFGDHTQVTATPEGFKTKEYDHD